MKNCYIFTTALILLLPLVADASSADWERLFNGQVIVEDKENRAGIPGIQAKFIVSASIDRIWEVLLDYEQFPEIFSGIKKMSVLHENHSGAFIEFWIDAVLAELHYILYRHYEIPRQRITWKRISGDLQVIEGSWEIRDTAKPGATLVIYESYVKVGGAVPTRLIRWGAKRKAREMGKQLRRWIESEPLKN